MTTMDIDLVPTADVALMLRVTVRQVNRLADGGQLPAAVKLPGVRGARLFARDAVERYLEQRGDR